MGARILYDTMQNVPNRVDAIIRTGPGSTEYPIEAVIDYATNTLGQWNVNDNGVAGDIDFFLTGATGVNCVGIAEHNFPDGCTVSLRDATTGTIRETLGTTQGRWPQLFKASNTYTMDSHRLRVSAPGAPGTGLATFWRAASIFMGVSLELPMGVTAPSTPPPYGRQTKVYPNVGNKGGHFLGSHVKRTGWQFTIEQTNVDPAWVDQFWLPFARHAEHRPFFYQWDTTRPEDTMYCWATKINPPRYTSPTLMAFSMACQGRHYE